MNRHTLCCCCPECRWATDYCAWRKYVNLCPHGECGLIDPPGMPTGQFDIGRLGVIRMSTRSEIFTRFERAETGGICGSKICGGTTRERFSLPAGECALRYAVLDRQDVVGTRSSDPGDWNLSNKLRNLVGPNPVMIARDLEHSSSECPIFDLWLENISQAYPHAGYYSIQHTGDRFNFGPGCHCNPALESWAGRVPAWGGLNGIDQVGALQVSGCLGKQAGREGASHDRLMFHPGMMYATHHDPAGKIQGVVRRIKAGYASEAGGHGLEAPPDLSPSCIDGAGGCPFDSPPWPTAWLALGICSADGGGGSCGSRPPVSDWGIAEAYNGGAVNHRATCPDSCYCGDPGEGVTGGNVAGRYQVSANWHPQSGGLVARLNEGELIEGDGFTTRFVIRGFYEGYARIEPSEPAACLVVIPEESPPEPEPAAGAPPSSGGGTSQRSLSRLLRLPKIRTRVGSITRAAGAAGPEQPPQAATSSEDEQPGRASPRFRPAPPPDPDAPPCDFEDCPPNAFRQARPCSALVAVSPSVAVYDSRSQPLGATILTIPATVRLANGESVLRAVCYEATNLEHPTQFESPGLVWRAGIDCDDPILCDPHVPAVPCFDLVGGGGAAASRMTESPDLWYFDGGRPAEIAAHPLELAEGRRDYLMLTASNISIHLAEWSPGDSSSIEQGAGNQVRATPRDFAPANPNRAANLELLRARVGERLAIDGGRTSLSQCRGRVVIELDAEAWRLTAAHQQFSQGPGHRDLLAAEGWDELYDLTESEYDSASEAALEVITSAIRAAAIAANPAITKIVFSWWQAPFALFRSDPDLLDHHLDQTLNAFRWGLWLEVVDSYDWAWAHLGAAVLFDYNFYSVQPKASHPYSPLSHARRITTPELALEARTRYYQLAADRLASRAAAAGVIRYVLTSRGYRATDAGERSSVQVAADLEVTGRAMLAVGVFEAIVAWAPYGGFDYGAQDLPNQRDGYPDDLGAWLLSEMAPGLAASGFTFPNETVPDITVPRSFADTAPAGIGHILATTTLATGAQYRGCFRVLTNQTIPPGLEAIDPQWLELDTCDQLACIGDSEYIIGLWCTSGRPISLPVATVGQFIGQVIGLNIEIHGPSGIIVALGGCVMVTAAPAVPIDVRISELSLKESCRDCTGDPECRDPIKYCGTFWCPPCRPDDKDGIGAAPAPTGQPITDRELL